MCENNECCGGVLSFVESIQHGNLAIGVCEVNSKFDLENEIMNCWRIIDDLKSLREHVMENEHATNDSIANVLSGLETLYNIKFEKLFLTFENTLEPQAEEVFNFDEDDDENDEPSTVPTEQWVKPSLKGYLVDGEWVDADGNPMV